MSTKAKLALTIAVIGLAVGYMIVSTLRGGGALEYYKHVDEVTGDLASWTGRRLQLHGNVVQGTIFKREGSLDFRFALHRKMKWVDVSYSGIVPDTFKDCAEVVVKGQLMAEGGFVADEISAKCPSKYDGKRRPGLCGEALRDKVLARRTKDR